MFEGMYFGPGKERNMVVIKVDNLRNWMLVAVIHVCNQIFSGIASAVIESWIINEVQNDAITTLRLSEYGTYIITILYEFTSWSTYFVSIFLSISRLDMMILGMLGMVVCRFISVNYFIRSKKKLRESSEHLLSLL
jgi:hypothetical protein